MQKPRSPLFAKLGRGAAVLGFFTFAGCKTSIQAPPNNGYIPGFNNVPVNKKDVKPAGTGAAMKSYQQVLPDGRIQISTLLGDNLFSRTIYGRDGIPQNTVNYDENQFPARQIDYDARGQITRGMTWYPGGTQIMRVEEYEGGNIIVRFTTYWPNGNTNIISEANVSTPNGPVNRVREWYANGYQKQLRQYQMLQGASGSGVGAQILEGRQTQWDDSGHVTFDAEFDNGALILDYLNLPGR